jgi:CRISPR-associated endonuclease Csn1
LNDLNKIYQSQNKESKELIQQEMSIKKPGGSWAFEKPWDSFVEDTKSALESCIVSIKNRNRLLTKGVNKFVRRNSLTGLKEENEQVKGKMLSVRGALHNPQVFGQMRVNEPERLVLVLKWYDDMTKQGSSIEELRDRFVHEWQYLLVKDLFEKHHNDLKKINAFLKKNPIIHKDKALEYLRIFKWRYTKKTSLATLTNAKVKDIANQQLKEQIENHIASYGKGDIKKAFNADGMMVFNQDRKIPVNAVKVIEGMNQEVGESLGKQRLVRKDSMNSKLHINSAGNYAFAIYENE